MAGLDAKIKELVGIGVSVVAHCRPCLQYHVKEARRLGVANEEIKGAVEMARAVRSAGISHMDNYTDKAIGSDKIEEFSEGV